MSGLTAEDVALLRQVIDSNQQIARSVMELANSVGQLAIAMDGQQGDDFDDAPQPADPYGGLDG
jgi:hypothetical protein